MRKREMIELIGGPSHGKKIPRLFTYAYIEQDGQQGSYKLMYSRGFEYYAWVGWNSPRFIGGYNITEMVK